MSKLQSHLLLEQKLEEEGRRVLIATNHQSMEVLAMHGEIRTVIIVETQISPNKWESLITYTVDEIQSFAPVYFVIDSSPTMGLTVQASMAIVKHTGEILGDDHIVYSCFYDTQGNPNPDARNEIYRNFISPFVHNERSEDSAILQTLSNN